MPAIKAHAAAGFRPHAQSAHRLAARPEVRARIEEILQEGAERAKVTIEQVLRELAALAFSDIRRAVEWRTVVPDAASRAAVSVTSRAARAGAAAPTEFMRLFDSDQIDDATAAAIAEVRRGPGGRLSIKFHDKHAALVSLGKHLGALSERLEPAGMQDGPVEEMEHLSDEELERIIRAGMADAASGEKALT